MYALLILCYLVTSCISFLRVLYSNTNAHAYVLVAPCVCAHYRYVKTKQLGVLHGYNCSYTERVVCV